MDEFIKISENLLNFEEFPYSSKTPPQIKSFSIENTSIDKVIQVIDILSDFVKVENSPIVLNFYDENNEILTRDRRFFRLDPSEKYVVHVALSCVVSSEDINNPRTSYFTLSSSITIQYLSNDETMSIQIPVLATLCMSIVHVDEKSIVLDSCPIDELTVRNVQIWNRSECPLKYQLSITITSDNLMENENETIIDLSMFPDVNIYDFESHKELQCNTATIHQIPTFAAKRIRLQFLPKVK